MKNIQLSEGELLQMKQLYLTQLADAQRKVDHLKAMLAKLGDNTVVQEANNISEVSTDSELSTDVTGVRSATVSFIPKHLIPKRGRGGSKLPKGRKSKWGSYIQGQIRVGNRLLTSAQLLEAAMKRTKNKANGEEKTKQAIAGSLHRLTKVTYKLRTIRVDGISGLYYGLASWFTSEGQLKPRFDQFGNIDCRVKTPSTAQENPASEPKKITTPGSQKRKPGRPKASAKKSSGSTNGSTAKKATSSSVTTTKTAAKKTIAKKATVKKTGAKRGRPVGSKNKKKSTPKAKK